VNLEELQAFVAVFDHGSVLAAADAMGVARTTLRRRLDELEARAGVPLLHRTTSGVVPTEAGQVLITQSRRILREADTLLASVREIGTEPSGLLRVAMPTGLAPDLLVPGILTARQLLPKIDLELRLHNGPLDDLLSSVELAVQLGAAPPTGPWITFVVHRVREQLLASPAYLAEHGHPKTLDDLLDHRLLTWSSPDRPAQVLPLWGGGTLPVMPNLSTGDIHLLHLLAQGGHGIALAPDGLPPAEGAPLTVPVLPDLVGRVIPVRVCIPEALVDIPKVRVVVDMLRAVAATLPPG
jgi:DNA-binding transcriptional LysR family regulator